ncbi:DNA alkylation repair protein [Patulibacter sp. NPDC049589]|uniref:DNA alkylation repair protein n=1 Tax=Patulibacter sp. NPDC049589 TaxID=3154731 RepID=UPI00341D0A64
MPTAEELLGDAAVAGLVACLERTDPGLRVAAVRRARAALGPLAFGERVTAVSDALLADLPDDLAGFAAVLRAALRDPAFSGWMIWAVADAASRRALEDPADDALETGLALLRELTPRLTAEAAIRRLLQHDPDRALAVVTGWTTDPDPHVRRLASEGTRPFLPWARRVPALAERPTATVPILDALRGDPSEYVRRSVANHLNDLSRVDPELAVATAGRWQLTLAPGERTTLARRRPFVPITTRRYHAGEHAIELQVNGRRYGRAAFELVIPA